ncbi:hypothetical protein U3516DRAFT_764571 [Neocallimastix sp. 'constans']
MSLYFPLENPMFDALSSLLLILIFTHFILTKDHSNSNSLITTDLVIQILDAADESCIYKSVCKPKTELYKDKDGNKNKQFVKFDIMNNNYKEALIEYEKHKNN